MFYRSRLISIASLLFVATLLSSAATISYAQNSVTAVQPRASVSVLDSTKEQDGFVGSVRRVKIESAKIEAKDGQAVEGPRRLLEMTTYSVKGTRIENVSYPITDSLIGKEEYKLDEHGNIVEMTMRDDKGMIINRESYSYEFDSIGNWTKMVTSLVLFENGELKREPVEVTYRTLTYYYDDSIAKMTSPSELKAASNVPAPAEFKPATFESPKLESGMSGSTVSASDLTSAGVPPVRPQKKAAHKTTKSVQASPLVIQPVNENTHVEKTDSPVPAPEQKQTATSTNASKSEVAVLTPVAASSSKSNLATDESRARVANEYFKSGLSKFASGDLKGASEAYLESIKLEPRSAEVYLNLGLTYLKLEKDKDAAKAFNESVKLNPQSAEGFYGLGLASFRMRKFRDAASAFKKATTIIPNMAKAHYGLSLAYQELNEELLLQEEFRILERLDKELARKLYKSFPQVPLSCKYSQVCQ